MGRSTCTPTEQNCLWCVQKATTGYHPRQHAGVRVPRVPRAPGIPCGGLVTKTGGLAREVPSEEIDPAAEASSKCLVTGRTDVRKPQVQVFEPVVRSGRPLLSQFDCAPIADRVPAEDEPLELSR